MFSYLFGENDSTVQIWYASLCIISVINIIGYAKVVGTPQKNEFGAQKDFDRYVWWMRFLAAPYVFQCAWRSFWPEIYNIRVTFWDTPLNSIFIGRGLATIGEVTWVMQIALGLMWCARQIKKYDPNHKDSDLKSIDRRAIQAVVLCFIAEFPCNYACITGIHFFNVIETTLWNIALGMLIPDCYRLYNKSKELFDNHNEIDGSQVTKFILYCLITCVVFLTQVSFDHMPTQYRLWVEGKEIENNSHLYDFWPGLKSTIFEREVSQTYELWQDDMFWMFGYFWFGVWLTIFAAQAPRLHKLKIDDDSRTDDLPLYSKENGQEKSDDDTKGSADY